MNYRTKSLFHYTQSRDLIIEILESGRLLPNFCKEDLSTEKNKDYYWGIPMVCFCDIPLSRAQNLIENYGHYAIAFDKEWGMKNGCNPVHYVSNEAILNSAIYSLDRIRELKIELRKYKPAKNERGELLYDFEGFLKEFDDGRIHNYLLGYIKKYIGEWRHEPYCNYDENEWRYVLQDGENDVDWLFRTDFDKWRGDVSTSKPEPLEELRKNCLRFSIEDVKHIVLDKESEISEFVFRFAGMDTICGMSMTSEMKSLLYTKITSFERINSEF